MAANVQRAGHACPVLLGFNNVRMEVLLSAHTVPFGMAVAKCNYCVNSCLMVINA